MYTYLLIYSIVLFMDGHQDFGNPTTYRNKRFLVASFFYTSHMEHRRVTP